jgi:putative transposase
MSASGISNAWRMPDAMWQRIEPLLPKYRKSRKGGRPRAPLRQVLDGIFYVLRTGCQWKAVPREFGSGSTLHRYFQAWIGRGIFRKLWKAVLLEYDELKGIQWDWQSLDGAMTKAPLGGEKDRQKPDRSRQVRYQAVALDRRGRRSVGRRGQRRQYA